MTSDIFHKLLDEAIGLTEGIETLDMSSQEKASIVLDAFFRASWHYAVSQGVPPLQFVWGLRKCADALERDIVDHAHSQMEKFVGDITEEDRISLERLKQEALQALDNPTGTPIR